MFITKIINQKMNQYLKRENFAVFLRKAKKDKIINNMR